MERMKTMEDGRVLKRIRELVEQEEHLYTRGNLGAEEQSRLRKMKVELDQCWDLLRQRRALREAGRNPDDARIRPPDVVQNYVQ